MRPVGSTGKRQFLNRCLAQRLPNGNTLVSSPNAQKVAELDRNGQVVWEYKPGDNMIPWKARRR